MSKITIGSTIIGRSGKELIVDRLDGDIICCGETKVHSSAIVRVLPSQVGDKVEHIHLKRIGFITDIRTNRTPKGTEFVQYLVGFGTNEKWCETVGLNLLEVSDLPDSLKNPIPASTPLEVPNIKLKDKVRYVGSNSLLRNQYKGVLEVWMMGDGGDLDKCTCLKPDERATSWLKFSDLELVEVTA